MSWANPSACPALSSRVPDLLDITHQGAMFRLHQVSHEGEEWLLVRTSGPDGSKLYDLYLVSSRDFRLDGEKNISTSRLKKRIAYYDWGQRPCSLTSFARTSCGSPCRSGIRNSDLAVCQSGTRLHTSGGSPMNRLRPDLASHDNCGYETKIYSA